MRLVLPTILGILLVFGMGWARWAGVVARWVSVPIFVFFGLTTSGGGIHYLRHGDAYLGAGLALLSGGLLYLASAVILVFSTSVRAWFRGEAIVS